jgi:hypothetical protein
MPVVFSATENDRFQQGVISIPLILEGWLCAFCQWVQLVVTDILIRTAFAQI